MNIALHDNRIGMLKAKEQSLQSSFTDALKQKYCIDQDDQPTVGYIIMSPKRKSCAAQAELAHLNTVVLNGMNLNLAGIPQQGLSSLCPNIVDLDLANNQFCHWSELLAILSHLPKVRYVNVSRNSLQLDCEKELPKTNLSVENLALNKTGVTIQDVVLLSQIMPALKELHLCDNDYEILDAVDDGIRDGHFSTLECLRLNNNNIKSWMEVWKLRYLPQLKQLILSGNPLSEIFYSKGEESSQLCTDSSTEEHTEICNDQKDCSVSEDEIFLHISTTDCDDLINTDSNEIESEFQDLSFSTLGCDEDGDNDGRPYSRVARHDDSIVTDDDNGGGSDREEENMNFNNNGHLQHKKSLYETAEEDGDPYYSLGFPSQEDFDAAVDAAVLESLLETEALLQEEVEEMHKAWAEAFLQEIIDNLVADQIAEGLTDNFHNVVSPILEDVMTVALDSVIPKELIEHSSSSGSSTEDDDDEVSDCLTLDASNCSLRFSASATIVESSTSSTSMTSTDSTEQHYDNDYKFKWLAEKETHFTSVEKSPSSSDSLHSSGERCLFSSTEFSQKPCKHSSDFQSNSNLNQNAILDSGYPQAEPLIPAIDNIDSSFPIQDSFMFSSSPRTNSHCMTTRDGQEQASAPPTSDTQLVTSGDQPSELCNCDNQSQETSDFNNTASVHVDPSASCEDCQQLSNQSNSILPFQYLETLCLSQANISHWKHLQDVELFPQLTSVRMLENPLYSSVNPEDRRKLYISSLPKITVLNGSEVTVTEREKAERFYLRHFMDAEDKPDNFHTLVEKHGPPVRLVEIDLSKGYQKYVSMTFILKDSPESSKGGKSQFTKKVHMQGLMGSLRGIIAKEMKIPKHSFIMFHSPCGPAHPDYDREIIELRCEGLPITRFDFSDGDEIHIELTGPPVRIY